MTLVVDYNVYLLFLRCQRLFLMTTGILNLSYSSYLSVFLHLLSACPSASPGFWLCQAAPGPTGRGWGDPACQSGYFSDVTTNSGHAAFTGKSPATGRNCQQEKPHEWQTQKVSLYLHMMSATEKSCIITGCQWREDAIYFILKTVNSVHDYRLWLL